MKLNLKFLKSRRGISPIIAVLLLLAITSIASALLYFYVLSIIGEFKYSVVEILAPYESIMIDDVWYSNDELHVYVRNLGTDDVTISTVYIEQDGAIIHVFKGINVIISSNDVIELNLRVSLEDGSYLVKVATEKGSTAERRLIVWSGE